MSLLRLKKWNLTVGGENSNKRESNIDSQESNAHVNQKKQRLSQEIEVSSSNVPSKLAGQSEGTDKYKKNKDGRSFQESWIKSFSWIEYSADKDAVFCYPCKTFIPTQCQKHVTYTVSGYNNWKRALDKEKGFAKHEKTEQHISAMALWVENKKRDKLDCRVSTMISHKQLEKHRYYITSIVETIQFLVANELSLRGDYDYQTKKEKGLFIQLFDFVVKKDEKLAEIIKNIPQNAIYHSPEIQNEIISYIAETVKEDIAEEILNADVPFFSLLMDGTKNKNRHEVVSIGVRFVRDGKVLEHIVSMEVTEKCDAEALTNLALDVLKNNNLEAQNILSQCYDGASVMSGETGGVQTLLQSKLKKIIPYQHCFNHKLHLVVIEAMKLDRIKEFFDICSALYNFFRKGRVALYYKGKHLSRLLDQRWEGHYKTVACVAENYSDVVSALSIVKENKDRYFDSDEVSLSIGLYIQTTSPMFRFNLMAMSKILRMIRPADKSLQSREISLTSSVELVKTVRDQILNLRKDYIFNKLYQKSESLIHDDFLLVINEQNKEKEKKDEDASSELEKSPEMAPGKIICTQKKSKKKSTNNPKSKNANEVTKQRKEKEKCTALENVIEKDVGRGKRIKKTNSRFKDSVIYSTTGCRDIETPSKYNGDKVREKGNNQSEDQKKVEKNLGTKATVVNKTELQMKQIFYEAIDIIISELDERFSNFNSAVIEAIEVAEKLDINKYDDLEILKNLGVKLPSLDEMKIARAFVIRKGILVEENQEESEEKQEKAEENQEKAEENEEMRKKENVRKRKEMKEIFEAMHLMREAFPDVYNLLAIAKTFACSTALCESSFSGKVKYLLSTKSELPQFLKY